MSIYLDMCKKSCLKGLLPHYFGYVCHLCAVAFGVTVAQINVTHKTCHETKGTSQSNTQRGEQSFRKIFLQKSGFSEKSVLYVDNSPNCNGKSKFFLKKRPKVK